MHVNDIYKHYKGNEYRIVGMSYCAEGEKLVPRVEYMNEKGIRFSRSISNFLDIVDAPDYDYQGPRFTFIRSG